MSNFCPEGISTSSKELFFLGVMQQLKTKSLDEGQTYFGLLVLSIQLYQICLFQWKEILFHLLWCSLVKNKPFHMFNTFLFTSDFKWRWPHLKHGFLSLQILLPLINVLFPYILIYIMMQILHHSIPEAQFVLCLHLPFQSLYLLVLCIFSGTYVAASGNEVCPYLPSNSGIHFLIACLRSI